MLRPLIMLAILFTWLSPHPVGAHAFVDHAEPRVGQQVAISPSVVQVWFDQRLVGGRIRIEDAAGQEIVSSTNCLSPHDKYLLEIAIPQPLPDGDYHVYYEADDVHTHTTPGDHFFSVESEGAVAKPVTLAE